MSIVTGKNILLISFDDAVAFWHYKTLFGQELQTPNLDRICAQSTAFHAAQCQVPVCSPSRASFMTGLSPFKTGITDRDPNIFETVPPQRLWPARLKQAGYFSSTGGKVASGFRALPDWAHEIAHSDEPQIYRVARRQRRYKGREIPDHTSNGGFRDGLGATTRTGEKQLYDHAVVNRAKAFLTNYDDMQTPFYRGVGFQSPHGPWITPQSFKEMYKPFRFKTPDAWTGGFRPHPAADRLAEPNVQEISLPFWRKSLRNYFSSLSYADERLGQVWDALKASPHADRTVVIIVSDHGLHLGERDRFRKDTLWEAVTNVPLIIHDPDQPEGRVVTDPVGLIDLANTVMDYAGLPPVKDSPGRSLRPAVNGQPLPERAIPTFMDNNVTIRKGRYRFTLYTDGTLELHDVVKDRWQKHDLGDQHPAFPHMQKALIECCEDWGFDLETVPLEVVD